METMFKDLLSPDNLLKLDEAILSAMAVLVLLGLILVFAGLKRLFRGKLVTASLQGLSGLSLLFAGLLLLSIGVNLYSYDRLTYEQPIAELRIEQLGEQYFKLNLILLPENKTEQFIINGDEWQMDARIIKWHGWAQLLGLDAQYRLERISGRYSDIDEELTHKRTVYTLSPKDEIDYWKLINQYKQYIPWVDAYYGSATYLPMRDNAKYRVSLTQSGLVARAVNSETEEENKYW